LAAKIELFNAKRLIWVLIYPIVTIENNNRVSFPALCSGDTFAPFLSIIHPYVQDFQRYPSCVGLSRLEKAEARR
jgi:hypothetical protein